MISNLTLSYKLLKMIILSSAFEIIEYSTI